MNKLAVLGAAALLAGCQTVQDGWSTLTSSGDKATAVLQPTKGNNVRGTVTFVQGADQRARERHGVAACSPTARSASTSTRPATAAPATA